MPASLPGRAAPFLVLGRDLGSRLLAGYKSPALRGRLIEGPDEMMLGEISAEELGKKVGDRLELFGRRARSRRHALAPASVRRTAARWSTGAPCASSSPCPTAPEWSPSWYLDDDEALPAVTFQLQAAFPRLRVLPTAFLAAGFEQLAYIDAFIWVISLAALIVGAIGVLNTMLMSVSERRA